MSPNIQISPEIFPLVYKDIETGTFVAEILVPPIAQGDSKQVQVLLDSNIVKLISDKEGGLLSKIGWLSGRDSILSINPSVAFVEQFLSNPDNVQLRMNEFEDQLVPIGVYEKGFSDKFYRLLNERQDDLRRELGTLFCYVALIFHWERNLRNDTESINQWIQLFSEDIPRLQVFYLLGGLFIISGVCTNLCLKNSNKRIISFRKDFCRVREKEQNNLSRQLRNRSFDLLFFYQAPNLLHQSHKGYKSRILLLTKDKFLGELLCQLFCWSEVEEKSLWSLKFKSEKLLHENEKSSSLTESLMISRSQGRPDSNEIMVKKRLSNLINLTLKTVDSDMREALLVSLKEFNISYDEG